MLLLAIDTSTSAITVCLQGAGDPVAASVLDARAHTEHVAPLIERCLAGSGHRADQVTDVVVGTGPGPFTGLRVGIVTGLVFGHAREIPVHGVCSLDVLARAAAPLVAHGEFLVATDARRKEVYWARYAVDDGGAGGGAAAPRGNARAAAVPQEGGAAVGLDGSSGRGGPGAVRLSEPAVGRPADLPQETRALPVAGRGPVLYPELFPQPVEVWDVDAQVLAAVAQERLRTGVPMPVEPLYLRRPDALTSAERAAR